MNRIFHHARFVFAFVALASLLVIAAAAHDKHKTQKAQKQSAKTSKKATAFMGKGDGIESCPVTGEPITSKEVKAEFFGRTVYFCCEDCLADAQKNPAKYVKKTEAAQIAATKHLPKAEGHGHHSEHHAQAASGEEKKFLGKGDGIETCPVMGEKVDKEVKAEIWGRTVWFCCPDCIETVKKNPELYLKKIEKP